MTTTFDSLTVHDLDVTGALTVNGLPVGSETDAGPESLPVVFADSEATTVKQLVEDFNSLLGALRSANVIA